MNKGITLLILLVVLSAMGLVLYSHSTAEKPADAGRENVPLTAAADGSGADRAAPPSGTGLRPIDPPLGSSLGAAPATGGDAAPVRLTPGADGRGTVPPASRTEQTPPPPVVTLPADADRNAATPVAQGNETASAASPGGKPETPPAASTQPERAAGGSPGLKPWGEAGQSAPPAASAASATPQTADARPAADAKPLPLTGKHSLSAIALSGSGSDVRLRIEGGDPFPCKTFVLTDPDRLVIDLPGTWTGMKAPSVPNNTLVKNVRLGQQPAGPRLVLDLSRKLKNHSVNRSGNTVEIRLQ